MKANFPAHAIHTDLWQDSLPSTDFPGFTLSPCISSSGVPSPPCYHPLAVPCLFSSCLVLLTLCPFLWCVHGLILCISSEPPASAQCSPSHPSAASSTTCLLFLLDAARCCLPKPLAVFVSRLEPIGSQAMVVLCPFRASSQEEGGNDPN